MKRNTNIGVCSASSEDGLPDDLAHENIFFVDHGMKEITRFDPNGWDTYYDLLELDEMIHKSLPVGWTYLTPLEEGRNDGVQVFQEMICQKDDKDCFNYCVSWCFFWIELRLMNLSDPKISIEFSLRDLKIKEKEWAKVIEGYSNGLVLKMYDYLYKTKAYEKKAEKIDTADKIQESLYVALLANTDGKGKGGKEKDMVPVELKSKGKEKVELIFDDRRIITVTREELFTLPLYGFYRNQIYGFCGMDVVEP
jgi:hypothetical protein